MARKKKKKEITPQQIGKELSRGKRSLLKRPKSVPGRKRTAQRGQLTKRTLTTFGVAIGSQARKKEGAGRPPGTYKYGMPIQEYKRLQSKRRAVFDQFQRQQEARLKDKGFSEEQVRQLQQARAVRQPTPQRIRSVADDELEFTKFLAQTTVTPNTQRMIDHIRRVQLKSERDDVEQQRRIRERRMVADAGNLLKTPNIFASDRGRLDILQVEGNILTAPSVFKEMPENRIMRTNRPSVLQAREAGNQLDFF